MLDPPWGSNVHVGEHRPQIKMHFTFMIVPHLEKSPLNFFRKKDTFILIEDSGKDNLSRLSYEISPY